MASVDYINSIHVPSCSFKPHIKLVSNLIAEIILSFSVLLTNKLLSNSICGVTADEAWSSKGISHQHCPPPASGAPCGRDWYRHVDRDSWQTCWGRGGERRGGGGGGGGGWVWIQLEWVCFFFCFSGCSYILVFLFGLFIFTLAHPQLKRHCFKWVHMYSTIMWILLVTILLVYQSLKFHLNRTN